MTESALHAPLHRRRPEGPRFWHNLSFWGLLPSWLLMGFALILPIAIIAAVSVATRGAHGGFSWDFNPEGYRHILFNEGWTGELEFTPQYLLIILRTFLIAGATTLICLLFAVPVAYFISRQPQKQKAILVYLVTLPFWVSMILRVYAWMIILGKDGTLASLLEMLGLPAGMSFMFNDGATLTAMVYTYVPLMVLPVFASIEKLDGTLIEASHDLYGNRWVTLRRVILPLTMPGIIAGAILVFVPSLGAVLEPTLMGGGKQMMMGSLIHLQFGGGRNWPFGAAIAMTLMALVMIFLVYVATRAARKEAEA